MIATVWNRGDHSANGAGYGIKIQEQYRDDNFSKKWKNAILELGDKKIVVSVNVSKKSFWGNCRELIHREIGIWLIKNGKGTWEQGKTPKVNIEHISDNKFSVHLV